MKYAIIENGIVINIALADAPMGDDWIEATDAAHIGGTWNGKAFGPAPEGQPDPAIERAEARAYLSATDWFVTRQVETGKAVPDDIAAKRAEARKKAQA